MANQLASGKNLICLGAGLILVSSVAFAGTASESLRVPLFWFGLIILFLETAELEFVSQQNASVAEMVLAGVATVLGVKALFSSFGKTFSEYHVFLITLLVAGLIISYGAYKKMSESGQA